MVFCFWHIHHALAANNFIAVPAYHFISLETRQHLSADITIFWQSSHMVFLFLILLSYPGRVSCHYAMIFCCRKRNAATGFLLSENASRKLVIRAQVEIRQAHFCELFLLSIKIYWRYLQKRFNWIWFCKRNLLKFDLDNHMGMSLIT